MRPHEFRSCANVTDRAAPHKTALNIEGYSLAVWCDGLAEAEAKMRPHLLAVTVPILRNVAKTAPYFHDGSVPMLPEAVKVMARVQLGATLSDSDASNIVAFSRA